MTTPEKVIPSPQTPLSASAPPSKAGYRWLLVTLGATLIWALLARVPLIAHAPAHLDSDLAVDGLTLIETLQGHWRWHYPGTPHMGIPPVLLSWPQSLVLGATPQTLVSGGVIAYLLVIVATFGLAWRSFGASIAAWTLLPLALGTPGLVWLSGRITGGHLLSVAHFAVMVWMLCRVVEQPTGGRMLGLGLLAGLGIYLDRMLLVPSLLVTLYAMIATADLRLRSMLLSFVLYAAGVLVGVLPARIGQAIDSYDAYGSQFETILRTPRGPGVTAWTDRSEVVDLLSQHARLLAFECLPRLVSGHVLPSFRALPDTPPVPGPPGLVPLRRPQAIDPVAVGVTLLVGGLSLAGVGAWLAPMRSQRGPDLAERPADGVVRGLMVWVALAVLAGFLLNRHIYNADNYRYLVLLIVPWAIGVGRLLDYVGRSGVTPRVTVFGLATALLALTSFDLGRWYQSLGFLEENGRLAAVQPADPALSWTRAHLDEVPAIFADYWDAYRIAFLTGGQVLGVPYPTYPDRFPEVTSTLPERRPRHLLARPTGPGAFYIRAALAAGGRVVAELEDEKRQGDDVPSVVVIDWPRAGDPAVELLEAEVADRDEKGASVGQ